MCLCPFHYSFHKYIPIYFSINSFRCMNNEHKDHEISLSDFDFERTSYISETNLEEDIDESDLPPEMQRLLSMEDKQILPHQEVTELVNLGKNDKKKEVKIGSSLDPYAKKEIVGILKEYVDIFAWSYQDMSGLSTEIVEHQLPIRPECKPVQQKLRRIKQRCF